MSSTFEDAPPHKLIITGTGRAGTTFLVRLLTALGQPTGYTEESWRDDYFAHCHAGLERDVTDRNAPYIVKDPGLCVTLSGLLTRKEIVVDHAIVPIRELEAAANSRIRHGGAADEIPGGLVGTDRADQQARVLAERFHTLLHTLVSHDVPHTLLQFPRFVRDVDYAYEKLNPIFGFNRATFATAFNRVADSSLVHDEATPAPPADQSATQYRAVVRRKKRTRRLRRAMLWTGAAAFVAGGLILLRPGAVMTEASGPPLQAEMSFARVPGAGVAKARLRSWLLVGSHYRTQRLTYRPFQTLELPLQPLCLRVNLAAPAAGDEFPRP